MYSKIGVIFFFKIFAKMLKFANWIGLVWNLYRTDVQMSIHSTVFSKIWIRVEFFSAKSVYTHASLTWETSRQHKLQRIACINNQNWKRNVVYVIVFCWCENSLMLYCVQKLIEMCSKKSRNNRTLTLKFWMSGTQTHFNFMYFNSRKYAHNFLRKNI